MNKFDYSELDAAIMNKENYMVPYFAVIAAYNKMYTLEPDDEVYASTGELPAWKIISPGTNSECIIVYKGITETGSLIFRMKNSLFPDRGWHVVYLPFNNFHVVENPPDPEPCNHEPSTRETLDGHMICRKCGALI